MIDPAPDLPPWAAVIVAVLLLLGSGMTLIGSFGLARLRTFYDRAHAPTIGSSAGVACISLASILCFSVMQSRWAIQEALIFLFVTVTMPVTLMLLARASLFRDRMEGRSPVPPHFEKMMRRGFRETTELPETDVEEEAGPAVKPEERLERDPSPGERRSGPI